MKSNSIRFFGLFLDEMTVVNVMKAPVCYLCT